jgi:hypothetical protein
LPINISFGNDLSNMIFIFPNKSEAIKDIKNKRT